MGHALALRTVRKSSQRPGGRGPRPSGPVSCHLPRRVRHSLSPAENPWQTGTRSRPRGKASGGQPQPARVLAPRTERLIVVGVGHPPLVPLPPKPVVVKVCSPLFGSCVFLIFTNQESTKGGEIDSFRKISKVLVYVIVRVCATTCESSPCLRDNLFCPKTPAAGGALRRGDGMVRPVATEENKRLGLDFALAVSATLP